MQRILRSIAQQSRKTRLESIQRLNQQSLHPQAILFCCVDSRFVTSRFLGLDVGDAYTVRNPGNIIPFCFPGGSVANLLIFLYGTKQPSAITEATASLQLACCESKVPEVIVCGHSDCKAMKLLWSLRNEKHEWDSRMPLNAWLMLQGRATLEKYEQMEETDGSISFLNKWQSLSFEASIDRKKWNELDQLSQINCLQQLENIASHNFMASFLKSDKAFLHALWLNFEDCVVHYFSKKKKKFVPITSESAAELQSE
ncbi:Carbonic anhydrase [Trichuris trichiura]|uniref:Carbonic anhydrase n=1 Tax=Trichuris trichiura TaxID=36087 RepID=A0A077YZT0_TRITR|nr:Carbonic anhydrase [Trichuris trichiura]